MLLATMSWCVLMGQMTTQAEIAKRQGVPQNVALARSQMHWDSHLREAGALINDYVYRLNNDNRISPRKMGEIVKNTCENPPNALSGTTPTP